MKNCTKQLQGAGESYKRWEQGHMICGANWRIKRKDPGVGGKLSNGKILVHDCD